MDSKYMLGIDELDSQHEAIEKLCLALEEASDSEAHWCDLLEQLYEKLRFHFYAEESIMQVFSYPEAQDHKRSHLEILKAVESLKDKAVTDADIEKLRDQPTQLFHQQVLSQDMRFASFLRRNKDRLGIQ